MQRALWLLACLAAVLSIAAPVPAEDGFYVIAGRPAVGTKIASLPYTISTPGYYYLTGNLSYAGGNGIIIDSNNVTIDLMGFVLAGPDTETGEYSGIYMNGRQSVEIRNGIVKGWKYGVQEKGPTGSNHRVIGIRGHGNTFPVYLRGDNHLIQGCAASPGSFSSSSAGLIIYDGAGTISGCMVLNFSGNGISIAGGTASGNLVLNCGGSGIAGNGAATIRQNQVSNCATGITGGGGSIVGNAVFANTGQTGIAPSTTLSNLLDQNNVAGPGTHYGPLTTTVFGRNGG